MEFVKQSQCGCVRPQWRLFMRHGAGASPCDRACIQGRATESHFVQFSLLQWQTAFPMATYSGFPAHQPHSSPSTICFVNISACLLYSLMAFVKGGPPNLLGHNLHESPPQTWLMSVSSNILQMVGYLWLGAQRASV